MSIYASQPRTWTQLDALDVTTRRALLDDHAPLDHTTLGPRGLLRYLASPDRDAELAAYFYPADPSVPYKAVVVAVHGHGAYWQFEFLKMAVVGRAHVYEGSWVEAFNKAGYSVCGVDNTGSGRSSGKFGLVEKAEDLRDDVLALVRAVRGIGAGSEAEAALSVAPAATAGSNKRRGGGAASSAPASPNIAHNCFGPALAGLPGFCASLPLFLLGPSLGGGVAVQAALAAEARLAASASNNSSSPFAGVVLLAPLLGLEGTASRGWNPYLRRIAALLDACPLTREWPVAAQDANTMFPEQQLDFDTDPVTYHYPCRVHTAVQLLRACAGVLPLSGGGEGGNTAAAAAEQRAGQPLREAARRLRAPVLAFHSARDTLCDCSATEAFVAAVREGQAARREAGNSSKKASAAAQEEQQARLRRCDHLWHSVLREDARGELLREAVAWMDARMAGAGGGNKRSSGNGSGGGGKAAAVATAAARISVSATATAAAAGKAAAAAAPATSPRAPRGRRAAAR
jgi:alpha-beta hydrolase superfamily lysophospholipase